MPTVKTGRDAFERLAADAPPTARVPVAVRVTVDDPFDAYRRARDDVGGVYLGTTGGQSGWGYFATTPADFCEVNPGDGDSLPRLAAVLDGETLVRGDCSVPYPCGAIGWLSYDIARELEDLPEHAVADRALPRLQVATYDRVAAWEEPRGDGPVELTITACPRLDEFDTAGLAYEFGREHALELARVAVDGDPSVGPPAVDTDSAAFESDCTRDAFAERVRAVKQYIRDGDTFQANVSQRLTAPAAVHPVEAFDALRTVNPAPYSALVEFPGVDLVSASPELLLHRDGDRLVTEPIAGTRPRGETTAADEELEADLLDDEKERAEHAMLVDLERNDLGKVSRFGSVEVTDYRRVDRYSAVMHLVSEVEGRLRERATLEDAIAAVFPGGTITGAPKPRTMEIIDEVERTRRGPYTGSIGIFGFDGRATLNIVIRTLVRYADEYHLRVGAGIVHDSDPDSEYDETLDKGRALVTAVDEALGRRANLSVGGSR
ncbi:aminodeoxychorismate synthase, component I [Haloarcula marina]|uniref:aminodeoxychorismate synthase, component I n=1 Tax=Haloarcula marina TaxID=2961574 RepID=UPI0020B6B876|nr:aminodeoxychorismate synthase, component I [Halomicroarcula marina]